MPATDEGRWRPGPDRDDILAAGPVGGDLMVADVTGTGADEEGTTGYVRSPRDLLRLVGFATLSAVLLGLTRVGEGAILGFEEDLVAAVSFLSPAVERVLSGVLVLGLTLAVVVVWVVPIATRRYRVLGYVALSNVVTGLLVSVATWWLDRAGGDALVNVLGERAGLDSESAVSVRVLAQVAGAFVVLGPFVGRPWRRAGAAFLATAVVLRIVVSVELPAEVFLAVALGATVGSGVLLVLGRPSRRPTRAALAAALADAGLAVHELGPASVDARGSTPYLARTTDGHPLFVKVLGADERAADLLFRLWRFLRLRNVGDERPFSNLRRTVEHEALVALYARDVGIRTPRMRAVIDVGSDAMLLAYDALDGRSLDSLADDEVTDELVRATWEQVASLQERRIAHRDLRRANLFVGADGRPWMIDFGFSELAASPALLRADVAQMLASFALVGGAERAVRIAVEVLGPETVGAALPRLQPMALSGATQTALKERKGLLEEVQDEVVRRCGVEEIAYEQLSRVSSRTLFTTAMIAAVTYFLLPQLADLPAIVENVRDASWWWLAPMLVASSGTYVGAALGLLGAVPERLRLGSTLIAQVASSFASKLAPAGLGGMALNARFLQKQGVDQAVAVSSVGLDGAAGVAGHAILLVVFSVWAGNDAFGSIHLPDVTVFLLVGAAIVVVGAISLLIPSTRALVRGRILPTGRRALSAVGTVLRRPAKLALLLGGSMVVTMSYLVCAFLGIQAFGGGLAFATVGACYLLGSAVATAAPTPGGLGAMEAALVAAFVAAGLDNSVAVPAVFLFRLTTFWLPILPGWASFTHLRRTGAI